MIWDGLGYIEWLRKENIYHLYFFLFLPKIISKILFLKDVYFYFPLSYKIIIDGYFMVYKSIPVE